ncbi:MAG: nitrogen fixation protein NifZ [Afipia sp.]|nr:nitrogen fixation protein NifZ [Afipia sp.]
MSYQTAGARPVTIARVAHDARRRHIARGAGLPCRREFKSGDAVRSLTQVKNDGIYPHKDIGETLVHAGDAGIIRERWSFLGRSTTRSILSTVRLWSSCAARK